MTPAVIHVCLIEDPTIAYNVSISMNAHRQTLSFMPSIYFIYKTEKADRLDQVFLDAHLLTYMCMNSPVLTYPGINNPIWKSTPPYMQIDKPRQALHWQHFLVRL